jgi:hypothetical protein
MMGGRIELIVMTILIMALIFFVMKKKSRITRAHLEACEQPEQLRQLARSLFATADDNRHDRDVCAWLCDTIMDLPKFKMKTLGRSIVLSTLDAAELRTTLLATLSKVAKSAYELHGLQQLECVARLVVRLLDDPNVVGAELEWLAVVAYQVLLTAHSVVPLRRAILARIAHFHTKQKKTPSGKKKGKTSAVAPAELIGLLPMIFSSHSDDPAVMLRAWSDANKPAVIGALSTATASTDVGARDEAVKSICNMTCCDLPGLSLPADTVAHLARCVARLGVSALYNVCDSRSQSTRALAGAAVPTLVLDWVAGQWHFSGGADREKQVSFVRQKGLAALVCLASRGPLAIASFKAKDRAQVAQLESDADPSVARYARMVSERLANPIVSFLTPEEAKQLPTRRVCTTDKGAIECAICIELCLNGSTATVLECGHHFHSKCIQPWLCRWATCPSCRELVIPPSS